MMRVLLTDDLKWYGVVFFFVMWQKTIQLMDGLVFPNPKEALRSQDFYTQLPLWVDRGKDFHEPCNPQKVGNL